jgi:hypothetical protein
MKRSLLLASLFLTSSLTFAQQVVNNTENVVQFDPLFWKDKLKLDASQCQKIREINGEYYESLFTAYREERENTKALKSIADKSLLQRSQEIWETFHPKQRKIWKKMWNASTSRERTNES